MLHLERKKTMNVFKEAQRTWGSIHDFPVGQVGLDPMPHLSRSQVAQPFLIPYAAQRSPDSDGWHRRDPLPGH